MATSFSLPKNYSTPEGVKKGEEFSDLATFKIDGNTITLIAIGQDKVPVKGGKEDKPKGGKEAIKEQLSAMEDKKGSERMEEEETPEEEASPEEEMD